MCFECARYTGLYLVLKEMKRYSFQNYHMNSLGWSDVGYNFLIGEDGYIYEGRGFYRQGPSFAILLSSKSLFFTKISNCLKFFAKNFKRESGSSL